MAKQFNTGFWNHFSGENEAGKRVTYNKVNVLFGLLKYEQAKKSENGLSRGESHETSALFGAIKYKLNRGNGASHKNFSMLLHKKLPLYNKEVLSVKDGPDYLQRVSVKAPFKKKLSDHWEQNGSVRNDPIPHTVLDKLDQKAQKAENPYGDKINQTYHKSPDLRQYSVRHYLDDKPNLNNAAVTNLTTGSIIYMASDTVHRFRNNMRVKQKIDEKKRHTWFQAGAVASGVLLLASASAFPVVLGATLALKGYDIYRKRSNAKADMALREQHQNLTGAVDRYTRVSQNAPAGMRVDQSQIAESFEKLHATMEGRMERRKSQKLVENFGIAAGSIVGAVAMSSGFPGLNPLAVAVGVGGVAAAAKRQQGSEKYKKNSQAGKIFEAHQNMSATAQFFGQAAQDIMQKRVVVGPASSAPKATI